MKNVDEALQRDFDIASDEDATAAGVRVRSRLQMPGPRASEIEARLDSVEPSVPDPLGSVPSALRRKPQVNWPRTRWVPVAAAAVLVLATAIGTAIVWRAGDNELYRIVEGDVRQGETIRSNGGAGAVLALADGSRIEMRSHSDLSLERADDGLRIRLNTGGIIVNAATQRTGHLYVQTKDMTVSVVGTVFLVNAEETGSRVAVIEGEVRVQQGATAQTLRPGDQVTSNPGVERPPMSVELMWSRRAEAHMKLLEQAARAAKQRTASQAAPEPRVGFEVVSIRPSGPAVVIPGARGGGGGLNARPAPSGCVFDSFGYSFQIDPRRLAVIRTTLLHLAAYTIPFPGLPERRPDMRCGRLTRLGLVTGGPDWIRTDAWDVVATIPEGAFTRTPALTDPVLQQMLRTMLAERFGWVIRREKREVPVYLLKVGNDGPKFNGSIPLTADRWGGTKVRIVTLGPDGQVVRGPDGQPVPAGDLPPPPDGGITIFGGACTAGSGFACGGQLSGRNVSMTSLASHLFGVDGRPVLDRTGLTGRYDFHFIQPGVEAGFARIISQTILESYGRGEGEIDPLTRGLLKEIGLELEESTAPFEAWVIERVERPSEN